MNPKYTWVVNIFLFSIYIKRFISSKYVYSLNMKQKEKGTKKIKTDKFLK